LCIAAFGVLAADFVEIRTSAENPINETPGVGSAA